MPTQNQRSSADNDPNKDNDQELTTGEGKSGGNAGAGQSGTEGLGSEKRTDDERFGSSKPANPTDGIDDEGKKDASGKNDESEKKD